MKKYLAEFLGTFLLMFCGTGAIIVNQEANGALGHVGICIAWGFLVIALVYTLGHISGAHLNPAVTVSLTFAGLFEPKEILPYIVSQAAGAFAATALLAFLFPNNEMLGGTQPAGSSIQSFILEIVMGFCLLFVVLNVTQSGLETAQFAGIIIGLTVLVLCLFAGPISGTSLNPTRSLTPALLSGHLENLWIYLSAPFIGGILGALTWRYFKTAA